jgi:hypothetical protein
MAKARILFGALVAAVFANGHACAAGTRETVDIAERFGLLGNWAIDCEKPVAPGNPRVRYFVDGEPASVVHTYEIPGAPVSSDTVVYAEASSVTRMLIVMRRPGAASVATVLLNTKEGLLVTDVMTAGGDHLIAKGIMAANGQPTKPYRRCGD